MGTRNMTIRLAHFSDVHLTASPIGWRLRDSFSKKAIGMFNVKYLGRGASFRHAPMIADALMAEIRAGGFDHIVFSGDATTLAFESEFAHAATRLGVQELPGIAIPGNHDYYTSRCAKSDRFERAFGPWLAGERIGGFRYPFAKKVGHVWLIAVNSSHPRRFNIGASGTIGQAQLERFRLLCARLDAGPRIVVTHYPLRTAEGKIERRSHRLLDHAAAIETMKQCGIALWLHGHIHRGFVLKPSAAIPFPVIGAGSCTQTNRWMYNHYAINGTHLTMTQRIFNLNAKQYEPQVPVELELPV